MHSTPHLYVGWKPFYAIPHISNLYPIAIVLFRTVLLRATGALCYARVLCCINIQVPNCKTTNLPSFFAAAPAGCCRPSNPNSNPNPIFLP